MSYTVPPALAHVIAEGTLRLFFESLSYEYVLVETRGNKPFKVVGYVDLCNLVSGDRVILREYMVIREGGEYHLYDTVSYEDEQEKPLVYVESKVSRYGLKVTLQREAGPPKDVDYQFFRTKV